MKRRAIVTVTALVGAVLALLSGCKGTEYDELGAACSDDSACRDVCHLGFPGGMCTTACDADNPCEEGVCVTFSDGGWCMPECTENSDCRDGYSCILGTCRPKSKGGEPCDDSGDCDATGMECMEGICTHQCLESRDCADVEGTYCTADASGSGTWCLTGIVDPNMGVACFTEDPNKNVCADGYVCYPSNSSLDAYCTTECTSNRDCIAGMVCRDVDTQDGLKKMCVKADYCEPCNTDDECGLAEDKCLSPDPAKGGGNFCSRACDPSADDCPTDSKCTKVFFCEATQGWVADCAWCSSGCHENGFTYQCMPDYGSCVGDGSLCTPCRTQAECQAGDGGYCLTSLDNAFCTKPCNSDEECPEGYLCYDIGAPQKQCIPGNTSCTNPQIPQQ